MNLTERLNKELNKLSNVLVETRTPNQILLELNVINADAIDVFLNSIAERLPTPALQKWLTSRAKKYLINSEENNSVITQFSDKAEPWMKARQKEGVALYRFNPSTTLNNKLTHIVDWLKAANDTATGETPADQQTVTRAKKTLKGINNVSITQAFDHSENWVKELNSKGSADLVRSKDETGLVPVLAHGEFKWYRLTDQECLDREGNVMGHCVASYGTDVKKGIAVIYSLRDAQNYPHVTVEVRQGQLEQVKGKQNRAPVEKYERATIELLNTLGVGPNRNGMRDIKEMNLLYNSANHKYGHLRDVATVLTTVDGKLDILVSNGESGSRSGASYYGYVGDNEVFSIEWDGYEYTLGTKNEPAIAEVNIAGAKYAYNQYKIAKVISSLSNQLMNPETGEYVGWGRFSAGRQGLGDYLISSEDNDSLIMYEDQGEEIYDDGVGNTLRKGPNLTTKTSWSSNTGPMVLHLNAGKLADKAEYTERDGKEIWKSSGHSINDDSKTVIINYINSLDPKARPYLADYGIYQNVDDHSASETLSKISKPLAKSGSITLYHTTSPSIFDRRKQTKRYVVAQENQQLFNINYGDDPSDGTDFRLDWPDEQTVTDAAKDIVKVLNKLKLGEKFPFNDSSKVSALESVGIYFSRDKRLFTTDHSIAGEHYKHEEEGFTAIRTHNHLKVYNEGIEVAQFSLHTSYRDGKTISTITDFTVKDRLQLLNNLRKVADVLNNYGIRRDKDGYGATERANKAMTAIGFKHGPAKGWLGMKTTPKSEWNGEAEGTPYEVFKFRKEYLIKNSETGNLIATLPTEKDYDGDVLHRVELESLKSTAIDIVAQVLMDLTEKGELKLDLYDQERDWLFKMHDKGFMLANGGVTKMAKEVPTSIISKGPGGTWMEEAWTPGVDEKIHNLQKKAESGGYQARNENPVSKYHKNNVWPSKELYTLYNNKKPVLRVITYMQDIHMIYSIKSTDDYDVESIQVHPETNKDILLSFHQKSLSRLIKKEKLNAGKYLTDMGLYIAKGKLSSIADNPKLKGFIDGEIVYEDGHKWSKASYGSKWSLSMPNAQGRSIQLLEVEIDDSGINSIRFRDSKVKRQTKLYRPFINDMMDISDELFGLDE
jgi:hypothetical protein